MEARGDFPPDSGTQVLFSDGNSTLEWGDRSVAAVTVEGLFGQTVEAVGRTARMRDEGQLPVYFAPVDGLCPVPGEVEPRHEVAAAVGPMGDVVIVGGRDAEGRLLDDVVHVHDERGDLQLLSEGLPFPSVGQSVHAVEDRRFIVVGGAGSNPTALDQLVVIDLDDDAETVSDPFTIPLPIELGPARAYHAAARLPDGRVLVAGGCRRLTLESTCAVGEDDPDRGTSAPDNLPDMGLWIDARSDVPTVQEGPALAVPRFGAQLLVARDGVSFLVGGWDEDGAPVHVIERYRQGSSRFRRYGGDLAGALADDVPVVGAALHDGGVVLLVMGDGRVHWVTEHDREEYRPWAGWCEGDAPCFEDFGQAAPAARRGVLALPGERVMVDGLVLPISGIGLDGTNALDLFDPRPGATVLPPTRRVDTVPVMLADGTAMLVGGHDPATGELATPVALRVRPSLDGPDEGIPEVDRGTPGSLVARDPERAVLEGGTLRLIAVEDPTSAFPRVRAHARGFRSTQFRFEATVQVTAGQVVPLLVFEHGAVEAVSVSLEPDRVVGHLRDSVGRLQDFSCGGTGLDFMQTQVLRVDVRPGAIVVRQAGETIAECPLIGEPRMWSVGIGAAGSGQMLVYGLRLTRQ